VRLRAIPTLMRHAQIWQEDALRETLLVLKPWLNITLYSCQRHKNS
jgi:hypothetical protein